MSNPMDANDPPSDEDVMDHRSTHWGWIIAAVVVVLLVLVGLALAGASPSPADT